MTTTRSRKVYQGEFKAIVASEAGKGRMTINEVAKQYQIHPNQISTWKRQFLESLPGIFNKSREPRPDRADEELDSSRSAGSKRSLTS